MVIYPAPIYLYCKFWPKETAMAGKNTGLAVSVFFREKQFSQNPVESLLALHQKGLLFKALPELSHLVGLPQNPERHRLCAWGHTLRVLEELPDKDLELIMAALLHDVGKGLAGVRTYKNGYPNDFGHAERGAIMARGILKRFNFHRQTIDRTTWLIYYHMSVPYEVEKVELWLKQLGKTLPPGELYRRVQKLITLKEADKRSDNIGAEDKIQALKKVREEVEKFYLKCK
ncbi:HD domain-containing protein [Carboxydothermus ferrireducens]|uniref:HD domain-containing protein n=1 Tax=Carboxydothermus ferrireducens DSM 11255 TaxID=1119529 RepID=A0ABX2R9G9_9THEO|nr:HD domain-containing protein [Carboxydothermus ferrireducens]NYE56786.1 hypothetical protein [Carboxydothermus ferrireducens DSM 11255]